jgi:tetratricopeptide (TPR) repeat protein
MKRIKIVLLCSGLPLLSLGLTSCRSTPADREARYLSRGEDLLAKKDYARAELSYRNAATATPKDAEPYYRLGLLYLKVNDPQSAVRMFRSALDRDPVHRGAQLKLAELLTTSKEEKYWNEAITRVVGVYGLSPETPEAIDTLAIAEWKLGKPNEAQQRLEEALKRFPTSLESAKLLSRIKMAGKDWKGAEEVLKTAVADAPQSGAAAAALGDFYVFMRKLDLAEPMLKKALLLEPDNATVLMELGRLQITTGRIEEAEQTFQRLAANPDGSYRSIHAAFLANYGKRDAAIAELEALVQADPKDTVLRSQLVSAYLAMQRIGDAEAMLAAALKRNPKDADALLLRAQLRLRSGKSEDAARDARGALYLHQDSAAAHFVLGQVLNAEGLKNQQRDELQQALNLNPEMLDARLALAANLLADKQSRAALNALDQAPATQKTNIRWIVQRNWALIGLGMKAEAKAGIDQALHDNRPAEAVFQDAVLLFADKNFVAARAELEELLDRGTTDLNIPELMMQTYVAQNQVEKGMKRLSQWAAAHPQSAAVQHFVGQWYGRTGDLAAARKAFETVWAIDPHFTEAELSLAETECKEGKPAAARERAERVIAVEPRNLRALILLARALNESGDHEEEVRTYRAILAIDPSNLP